MTTIQEILKYEKEVSSYIKKRYSSLDGRTIKLKKEKEIKGFLKSRKEIEDMGFTIATEGFTGNYRTVVHPVGKRLLVNKKIIKKMGTSDLIIFRLKHDYRNRQIYSLPEFFMEKNVVYGEMIRSMALILEDDLFTL